MKKSYLHLLFICLSFAVSAQSVDTLTFETNKLAKLSVLADKNYSFEQISTDSSLAFGSADSLKPYQTGVYWLKIVVYNPNAYAENVIARTIPMLDNTLYYYDLNQNKWVNNRIGLLVPNNERSLMSLPCVLQGRQLTTLYVKMNLTAFSAFRQTVMPPGVVFVKEAEIRLRRQKTDTSTAITILIVFVFFLFNAYIYAIFRDKTYFYYLITQIGGIIYVLAANDYFNVLITPRFCQFVIIEQGGFGFYSLNSLLSRGAIGLVMFGFVQLTRTFLNTKTLLPTQDKILKYLLNTLIIGLFILSMMAINGQFLDVPTTLFDNVLVILLVLMIFYVTLVSYRRQYKAARYFLLANLIPLCITLILGVYYLAFPYDYSGVMPNIANLAVVAQAFCLALALVQRFLLIRDELKQKQLEAQELENQNEQIAHNNQLITLENARISADSLLQKTQNDLLQEKLDSNQRELASTTLYMYQKNEMLADLRIHVETLNKSLPNSAKMVIKSIENVIQNNLYLDADWERFRIHFEQVHPLFFEKLQTEHPSLTKNEIRLCAYFHMNLSTKEIAALLNIDPASVRTAKMRLNKKVKGDA